MKTQRNYTAPPTLPLAFAGALLAAISVSSAQSLSPTNAPAAPPKPPWDVSAAAGLTLTKGNSDTLVATLGLDAKRKWEKNELLFGAAGGYGENNSEINSEFLNAFGQYNRLFTERLYAGFRTDYNYDGIARLQYRVTVSPLAGYYLIKATNTSLSVEAGPSAVFEKYLDNDEKTYMGLRLSERFDQKLSATTRFWESCSYVPDVSKWTEKYVITFEAGIDSAINKTWSLRLVFQDIYDSLPASGRKNNDLRLIAGVGYKL